MTEAEDKGSKRVLRPRARIMRTLGEELISSESVAVIELVKNSYDADASFVSICFEAGSEKGLGGITIQDDGHGMTFQIVETSWMEPATNHKKKDKFSQFLNRRLLGEKGVGRFASSRLAEELELFTRSPNTEQEVYAFFDWSQFDNEEAYLDEVIILAEERAPEKIVFGRAKPLGSLPAQNGLPRDGTHGTMLRMNRLKRSWEVRDFEVLKRSLSRLISPFEADKGFRIFLQQSSDDANSEQELEAPEVIKYPHYTLVGNLDTNGNFNFDITIHALGETETFDGKLIRAKSKDRELIEIPKNEKIGDANFLTCGPLDFKVLVWDRDQLENINQKLGIGIRDIRADLDSVAGVSIFRDGFRVLPYGEPENDWLKLNARRVQNPTLRLSNNQITGNIRISSDSNPLLKDQSNREGLDSNDAYLDLQDCMKLALSKLEGLRFKAKSKKSLGSETVSTEDKGGSLLIVPDTSELRQKILCSNTDPETIILFDATTKAWEDQVARIREVLSRYHALATLGQLVDKVVHDGRQPLSTIQTQAALMQDSVGKAIEKVDDGSACYKTLYGLSQRLLRIKDAANLIDLLLKRIEPLGGRRRGKPTKVYINEIIKNAFSHFQQELDSLSVKITLPELDDLVQVDALELQEVLINLISNSIYWLSRVPVEKRAIVVQCSRPNMNEMEIIFADSGPGIPKSNISTIFEPYFTTKPDGVGLGLVIAGEIIKDYYNGSLELMDSGPLGGAVFKIKLRKRV